MDARKPLSVQSPHSPRHARAAAPFAKPFLDRRALVAAIAPERDVRDAPFAGCLSDPRLGHGEKLRDLAGCEKSLAHRGTSFPHAAQPGLALRAKSSSLEACGYICSISS
jgi:hypothetical protein